MIRVRPRISVRICDITWEEASMVTPSLAPCLRVTSACPSISIREKPDKGRASRASSAAETGAVAAAKSAAAKKRHLMAKLGNPWLLDAPASGRGFVRETLSTRAQVAQVVFRVLHVPVGCRVHLRHLVVRKLAHHLAR